MTTLTLKSYQQAALDRLAAFARVGDLKDRAGVGLAAQLDGLLAWTMKICRI